jgi:hypothetical protein
MADPVPERPYGMKGKTYVLSILCPKKIGLSAFIAPAGT